jgi:hypothetical protein
MASSGLAFAFRIGVHLFFRHWVYSVYVSIFLLPYAVLLWRLRRWREGAGLGLAVGLGALGCVIALPGLLRAVNWGQTWEGLAFLGLLLANGTLLTGGVKARPGEKAVPRAPRVRSFRAPPRRLWTVQLWVALSMLFILWLLFRSALALRDPCVHAPAIWFLAQVLVLLPYVAITGLLQAGRVSDGLAVGVTWGALAALFTLKITWTVAYGESFGVAASARPLGLLPLLFLLQVILTLDAAVKYRRLYGESGDTSNLALVIGCILYFLVMAAGIASSTSSRDPFPRDDRRSSRRFAYLALRTVANAEIGYANTYGGFSESLRVLAPPAQALKPSASAADLIDDELASGVMYGYRFSYVPGPRDTTGHIKTFTVTARPVSPESGQWCGGVLNTFLDESGVIRGTTEDRPANASDPPFPP